MFYEHIVINAQSLYVHEKCSRLLDRMASVEVRPPVPHFAIYNFDNLSGGLSVCCSEYLVIDNKMRRSAVIRIYKVLLLLFNNIFFLELALFIFGNIV